MKKEKPDRVFVNPFSEAFIPTWDLWKEYRWEEHKFKYKGLISEQMAINRLVEVAEGDEEKAVRIVKQSISRGWMDFYALKQPSNKEDGKSKQSTTAKSGNGIAESAVREFIKRNRDGENEGDNSHLKAV